MEDEEPRQNEEPRHDVAALWPAYLDYYREQVIAAVLALPDEQRRRSQVPSGWTPIELLSHVLHMERRWFLWGFLGEPTEDVWGDWTGGDADPWQDEQDTGPARRWHVPADVTAEELAARLREVGARTTQILHGTPLDTVAAAGDRFEGDPAPLEWICFHVLQEYARHAGHLDIAVELSAGDA